MKKLFLLSFALLGVVLSSCGNDDEDISGINNVKLTKSSCISTNDKTIITASVENYNPQNIECWLNVGASSDYMSYSQIWSMFKMNYDLSKKELSSEIPADFFTDKTNTLFGHIIITDFVKHESIELGEPIVVYTSLVP